MGAVCRATIVTRCRTIRALDRKYIVLDRKHLLEYDVLSYRSIVMKTAKIAITIEQDLLNQLDRLVAQHRFPNRSRAVQEAVREKLEHLNRSRLARECAKLDPQFEQALADEGLAEDLKEWPEY
jgi:Arc/MetJ-type ribon-helix-helix transcriptional regulator